MFSTNNFVDKKTTENGILKALFKLTNNLDKIELAINHNKTYLQKNSYQLLANLLTPENNWERLLYSELAQMCFGLELKCHGSSIYFLRAFDLFAREYVKNDNLQFQRLVEDNHIEKQRYLSNILKVCVPASPLEIKQLVDKVAVEPLVASTVLEATNLAGIEGNIIVEEGNSENIVVELEFGYNFLVQPFKGFIPTVGSWNRSNVKVLLVDGMIEKVSEIDKLLTKSFETKNSLMIMAQGFSEEVVATIWNNNNRGVFDVMPVRLQQSLEALNVLNDISAVCGGDVLSTLKGEMLMYVDYDELPVVEQITITGNVLTLQNARTRGRVISHLNYLNNRRREQQENTSVTDLADLTTKRIQNLLSHTVKVTLPKKDSANKKAAIDNAIRACRTTYTYGLIEPEAVSTEGMSQTWQRVHKELIKDLNNKIPSILLYFSCGFASDLAAGYFTSAGALMKD
jgi:hypothetical protein